MSNDTPVNTDTITVDKKSLETVLRALLGAPHQIRELQATRGLPDCPITILVENFNTTLRGE